jgi:hypothetical protein
MFFAFLKFDVEFNIDILQGEEQWRFVVMWAS